MDEQEQIVINLIVNSGSARSSAIEAIQYAKAGDLEKADESLNLLMVHAQDHLMTALVVIDLAQEFIDVYKKIG